jgi:hypothetical protein
VQPKLAALARQRLADIEAGHPALAGRVRLIEGDITRADLGLGAERDWLLSRISQVYHLAAVYDLAAARELATRALEGSGITCPRFSDYAGRLADFVRAHPDVRAAAMV